MFVCDVKGPLSSDEIVILWVDEILHYFETVTNHCTLVFTEEASPQGFLGGAGFRPSTVGMAHLASQAHC